MCSLTVEGGGRQLLCDPGPVIFYLSLQDTLLICRYWGGWGVCLVEGVCLEGFDEPAWNWHKSLTLTFHWQECSHKAALTAEEAGKWNLAEYSEEK